jgi:hypothetical protein
MKHITRNEHEQLDYWVVYETHHKKLTWAIGLLGCVWTHHNNEHEQLD